MEAQREKFEFGSALNLILVEKDLRNVKPLSLINELRSLIAALGQNGSVLVDTDFSPQEIANSITQLQTTDYFKELELGKPEVYWRLDELAVILGMFQDVHESATKAYERLKDFSEEELFSLASPFAAQILMRAISQTRRKPS